MRRFLPTGADALDLDESTSAGIGNWQDLGRSKGSRRRASQLPMSKRCAEDKVRTAAGHKRWIVGQQWQSIVQEGPCRLRRGHLGRHSGEELVPLMV